jgi:methylenetetrahydrofolate dehydrogenase (NADP+)/methenyltetrahydrofolate cyclohydrolase
MPWRRSCAPISRRAEALAAKGTRPGLVVILVGEDPASQVYVRNKVAACGRPAFTPRRSPTADVDPQEVVLKKIAELNADPKIHGILVQLPLPKHFDEEAVLEAIAPRRTSMASTPRTSAR